MDRFKGANEGREGEGSMKITCHKDSFLEAYRLAALAAPTRCPKPILQNVKLEVTEMGAVLMATDLEFGVRVSVPSVTVGMPGAAILPARRFEAIAKEATGEHFILESTDRAINFRSDRSKANLPNENPDEFPNIVRGERDAGCKVSAAALCEMLRRAEVVVGKSGHKSLVLDGLFLEVAKNSLTVTGSDGRALGTSFAPCRETSVAEKSALIPQRSASLIRRMFSETDGDLEICIDANTVSVRSESAVAVARLLEGRYPQWRNVLPRYQNAAKVDVVCGPFQSAFRQVAAVCPDDPVESPKLLVELKAGVIRLSSRNANLGEVDVDIPVSYDGREVSVVIGVPYLRDFLSLVRPESVFSIEVQDGDTVVSLRPSEDHTHLIVPMGEPGK